jgi:hypothetical protein
MSLLLTEIKQSKLGSGRSERLETSFFLHVGHSLFPDRKAVMMQSLQNRCKHSFVVIVFLSISKQMGHLKMIHRDFVFYLQALFRQKQKSKAEAFF